MSGGLFLGRQADGGGEGAAQRRGACRRLGLEEPLLHRQRLRLRHGHPAAKSSVRRPPCHPQRPRQSARSRRTPEHRVSDGRQDVNTTVTCETPDMVCII